MGIGTYLLYACLSPVILCVRCFQLMGVPLLDSKETPYTEEETRDVELVRLVRPVWQVNIGNDIVADGYTPYEDAKACKMCQRINIDEVLSPSGYAHYESYGELEDAARSGCRLCTIILLAIERRPANLRAESLICFRSIRDSRASLKLIALRDDEAVAAMGEALKSDLVEIRLESKTAPRSRTHVKKDVLATIGMYTDEGTLALDFYILYT
jgi:hypothetical protein